MRPGWAATQAKGSSPASRHVPTSNCITTSRGVLPASTSIGRLPSRGFHSTRWLWKPVAIRRGRSCAATVVSCSAIAFQPSIDVIRGALAMMMYVAADDLVQLDRFLQTLRRKRVRVVVGRGTLQSRVVERFADLASAFDGPVHIGRVELDDLVAHLSDGGNRPEEVLRQFAAHRVQLETDWHRGAA